jgi:hypothetical protein
MSLMARLKAMWSRHDERLVEKGLETRAADSDRRAVPLPGEGVGASAMGARSTAIQESADEAVEAVAPQEQEREEFGTEI